VPVKSHLSTHRQEPKALFPHLRVAAYVPLTQEMHMKRSLLAGVAVLALSLPAFAQSTTVTTETTTSGATVTIAPEQRTKIKKYVVEQKVKPMTVEKRVTVGATLPAEVELHTVPSDWGPGLTRYRYVYSGDDVVLVEPSSRRVIQVIE
jgi:hypothetical protein